MPIERRKIIFTGRVQGVGFRMTTIEFAENFKLGGTVRNLPDGGVELIAQGEPAEINALVNRLREHFGTFIRNVDQTSLPAASAPASGIHVTH